MGKLLAGPMDVARSADRVADAFKRDQKAKQEQPNAPQNPAKSLTGAFDKRAFSWLCECTPHGPLHWCTCACNGEFGRQWPGTLTTGDQSGSTGTLAGPRSWKSPAAMPAFMGSMLSPVSRMVVP